MKKIAAILISVGVFLAVLSALAPFADIQTAAGQGMGIIGGAGTPTYWLVYSQKYLWLTFLSLIVAFSGVILLRKQ